jgi:hypothetical protein
VFILLELEASPGKHLLQVFLRVTIFGKKVLGRFTNLRCTILILYLSSHYVIGFPIDASEGGKLKGLPKGILRASQVLVAVTNEQQEGGARKQAWNFL